VRRERRTIGGICALHIFWENIAIFFTALPTNRIFAIFSNRIFAIFFFFKTFPKLPEAVLQHRGPEEQPLLAAGPAPNVEGQLYDFIKNHHIVFTTLYNFFTCKNAFIINSNENFAFLFLILSISFDEIMWLFIAFLAIIIPNGIVLLALYPVSLSILMVAKRIQLAKSVGIS
jgi:hypothetical protein